MHGSLSGSLPCPATRLTRIAVDLTPLLPGWENGGAKLLATELVRHLSRLAPETGFVLLTSDQTHAELSSLDAPNVNRRCVRKIAASPPGAPTARRGTSGRLRLKGWLSRRLPSPLYAALKGVYLGLRGHSPRESGVLRQFGVDLLFCPFTLPSYYDAAAPVVSVVYDLQYHYYPQFFEAEDRLIRERNFKETCRLADRLVCISDYVRSTVLETSDLPPQRVVTIPIRLFDRLQKPDPNLTNTILQKYRLTADDFLLYPANFWPHKNHEMLLTAFGMFRSRHPESKLSLVCTGEPGRRMEDLLKAVRKMGLQARTQFLGFVTDTELAALLASCRALVFPSLYEGFGMPILEAMAFGKPVLCSNAASLPEVGQDAAVYFDPRKPHEIVGALERAENDPRWLLERTERGKAYLSSLEGTAEMAARYLSLFRETAALKGKLPLNAPGAR